MTLSDKDFINSYILHIPSAYHTDDTSENKIIYALAYIGEGTSTQILTKLKELEPSTKISNEEIGEVLEEIYAKGLIKGQSVNGEMRYDTSKKLHPNNGSVNIQLIDPEADK